MDWGSIGKRTGRDRVERSAVKVMARARIGSRKDRGFKSGDRCGGRRLNIGDEKEKA